MAPLSGAMAIPASIARVPLYGQELLVAWVAGEQRPQVPP